VCAPLPSGVPLCTFTTPGLEAADVSGALLELTTSLDEWGNVIAGTVSPFVPAVFSFGLMYGMTWPCNVEPCANCPATATLNLTRGSCECDVYHYGPGCSLCRPEWDADSCDGSACSSGYVSGVASEIVGRSSNLVLNCSLCADGFCRSNLGSAAGDYCAPCDECSANGVANATSGRCICNPGWRGARCDECLPQFIGASCSECAPGYVNGSGTCTACDTDAGYCTGFLLPTRPDDGSTNILPWGALVGLLTGASAEPGVSLFTSGMSDPWLSFCAPCAACDPTAGVYDAAAASCSCKPTPTGFAGDDNRVLGNVTLAMGPSCTLRTSGVDIFAKEGGCFPAAARVLTEAGAWVRLNALPTATRVLAADPATGELTFSPVVAWWHHESDVLTSFFRLRTAAGTALTLTPNHYLHASAAGCGAAGWASASLTLPQDVRVGHGVWVLDAASDEKKLTCSLVASVALVHERGRYAPVTASGNVVVDGVSASSLVAYGRWPLWMLRAHHALIVGLHSLAGRAGLRFADAVHAPFYARRGVPQATNAAVARALMQAPGGAACAARVLSG
jgi:hypothetical protein